MNRKEIPPALVDQARTWLGKDGMAFFRKLQKDHGTVSPVMMVGTEPHRFPHAVHFREGMQVRNFMRSTGLCEGWDAHDYDDNWTTVIERAIEGEEEPPCKI
jgi:hypothetical protein